MKTKSIVNTRALAIVLSAFFVCVGANYSVAGPVKEDLKALASEALSILGQVEKLANKISFFQGGIYGWKIGSDLEKKHYKAAWKDGLKAGFGVLIMPFVDAGYAVVGFWGAGPFGGFSAAVFADSAGPRLANPEIDRIVDYVWGVFHKKSKKSTGATFLSSNGRTHKKTSGERAVSINNPKSKHSKESATGSSGRQLYEVLNKQSSAGQWVASAGSDGGLGVCRADLSQRNAPIPVALEFNQYLRLSGTTTIAEPGVLRNAWMTPQVSLPGVAHEPPFFLPGPIAISALSSPGASFGTVEVYAAPAASGQIEPSTLQLVITPSGGVQLQNTGTLPVPLQGGTVQLGPSFNSQTMAVPAATTINPGDSIQVGQLNSVNQAMMQNQQLQGQTGLQGQAQQLGQQLQIQPTPLNPPALPAVPTLPGAPPIIPPNPPPNQQILIQTITPPNQQVIGGGIGAINPQNLAQRNQQLVIQPSNQQQVIGQGVGSIINNNNSGTPLPAQHP